MANKNVKLGNMNDISDTIRNFKRPEQPTQMIYLIMRSYNNTVDTWTTVEFAFMDKTAAELKVIELEEGLDKNLKNSVEYYVEDFPIEG